MCCIFCHFLWKHNYCSLQHFSSSSFNLCNKKQIFCFKEAPQFLLENHWVKLMKWHQVRQRDYMNQQAIWYLAGCERTLSSPDGCTWITFHIACQPWHFWDQYEPDLRWLCLSRDRVTLLSQPKQKLWHFCIPFIILCHFVNVPKENRLFFLLKCTKSFIIVFSWSQKVTLSLMCVHEKRSGEENKNSHAKVIIKIA